MLEAVIKFLLNDFPHYFTAVSTVATVVARLTPTPKDDSIVAKIIEVVEKILSFLPTIGLNPATKRLKDAAKEDETK